MSETISDKIENDEWIEDAYVDFECPDGEKRSFKCGGTGYNQSCGGWEHTETGQIYAIANYGSERHWSKSSSHNITMQQIAQSISGTQVDNVNTGGKCNKFEVNKMTSKPIHGYQLQMMWYFEQKDIDVNKLIPIRFTWKHDVGPSYNLVKGPQAGKHVSESLPACIPRGMYEGIHDKEVIEGDWLGNGHTTKKEGFVHVWSEDVDLKITHAPTGGN